MNVTPSTYIPSNNEVHAQKIQTCLNVIVHLAGGLNGLSRGPQDIFEGGPKERPEPVAKEGIIALEVSLIKACNRLDSMLDDESRWSLPATDSQTILTALMLTQLRLQKHQADALDQRAAVIQEMLQKASEQKPKKKGKK